MVTCYDPKSDSPRTSHILLAAEPPCEKGARQRGLGAIWRLDAIAPDQGPRAGRHGAHRPRPARQGGRGARAGPGHTRLSPAVRPGPRARCMRFCRERHCRIWRSRHPASVVIAGVPVVILRRQASPFICNNLLPDIVRLFIVPLAAPSAFQAFH